MKTTIFTKLLLLLVLLTVVPLAILGFMVLGDLDGMGTNAVSSVNNLGGEVTTDTTAALDDLGKDMIKLIAEDVAKQLEIYIKAHPEMTVEDLQADPVFSELAVQPVGKTGYTAVTDVNSLVCRFHASENIVNLDLHVLEEKLPGFWSVMSKTEGGVPAAGLYEWAEKDGSVNDKYMYIAIVDAETADGITFSVAATTYMSEFNEPVVAMKERIDAATGDVESQIAAATSDVKSKTLWLLVIVVIVVLIVGYFFAHSITGPIKELTSAGKQIADGALETELPKVKSQDEIKELSDTMNLLVGAIKFLKKDAEKQKKKK